MALFCRVAQVRQQLYPISKTYQFACLLNQMSSSGFTWLSKALKILMHLYSKSSATLCSLVQRFCSPDSWSFPTYGRLSVTRLLKGCPAFGVLQKCLQGKSQGLSPSDHFSNGRSNSTKPFQAVCRLSKGTQTLNNCHANFYDFFVTITSEMLNHATLESRRRSRDAKEEDIFPVVKAKSKDT